MKPSPYPNDRAMPSIEQQEKRSSLENVKCKCECKEDYIAMLHETIHLVRYVALIPGMVRA